MSPLAFRLLLGSVLLHFAVSANLLWVVGIPYAHPGGLPPEKFHPATYGFVLAAAIHARRRGFDAVRAVVRRAPALAGFVALAALATADATLSGGVSGATVYVESLLSAGLLAALCVDLSPSQRRVLGVAVVLAATANVLVSLGELCCGRHLVPVYLEETTLVDEPGQFRGAALYDHPLTGAADTVVALLLLLGLRLRPRVTAPLALVLGAGLLGFGGRAALAAGALAAGALLAARFGRLVLLRRIGPALTGSALLAALAVPAAVGAVLLCTALGERIAAKLYVDPSAQSRLVQWNVVGLLDARALLFGSPIARTPELVFAVGLHHALTGIESFWLMALLNLGLVGFLPYVVAIGCLAVHLWRRAAPAGRLAVFALLAVASTSNSLGRKSHLLVVLVAAVAALPRAGRCPSRRARTAMVPLMNGAALA